MLPLTGLPPLEAAGTANTVRAPRASPSGFLVRDAAAGSAASAAGIGGTTLDGMLFVQEEAAESAADRRARRYGQTMLAQLGRLQRMLLSAEPDPGTLRDLAELVRAPPDAETAGLADAVAQLVLRARVELARYRFA